MITSVDRAKGTVTALFYHYDLILLASDSSSTRRAHGSEAVPVKDTNETRVGVVDLPRVQPDDEAERAGLAAAEVLEAADERVDVLVLDVVDDALLYGRFLADGRYELLNRLESGAEGVVFSARKHSSTSLNPVPRAIKIMYSHSDWDTTEAELQSLAAGHPDVADVHDVFEDAEYTYIVTDLFDAGDLHTYVWDKVAPLAGDVAAVKRIFLGILDGVAADLKLANILVDEERGRVCIADFGLATTEDWSCDYGAGTPCYMCPEALGSTDDDNETLLPYDTRRNDIWALGIILIELTCGLRPWEEASARTSDRFRAYAADPAALRTFLPISTALDALLRRILLVHSYTKRAPQPVTLEEIREAVERMERFWMDE
ncbi:kinase-like domain-containing protein [Epithele typhae]|uniref:kinase-like domain-containing protein n=1 Tax=Epithele typhae TaxID=378194 RepID=UPI0020080B79|nr:kinase-like domain-containing protein [Epithele typhae]KAH9932725.1 kinase-like domain-containing protein [Epithele typhae]